jgi:hypothetical protein
MSDAIVIGGGFYGAAIAIYLAKSRGFRNVVLMERVDALLQRASYKNQARVHDGYHYPRSFITAFLSRVKLPRFVRDCPDAVKKDFTKLYAIAWRNSKVIVKHFDRFCHEIGASIEPAEPSLKGLFSEKLIEEVFLVQEHAFDSTRLTAWALGELAVAGVQVPYGTRVMSISNSPKAPKVLCTAATASVELWWAPYLFNCTYSGLNQFTGDFAGMQTRLKLEKQHYQRLPHRPYFISNRRYKNLSVAPPELATLPIVRAWFLSNNSQSGDAQKARLKSTLAGLNALQPPLETKTCTQVDPPPGTTKASFDEAIKGTAESGKPGAMPCVLYQFSDNKIDFFGICEALSP